MLIVIEVGLLWRILVAISDVSWGILFPVSFIDVTNNVESHDFLKKGRPTRYVAPSL